MAAEPAGRCLQPAARLLPQPYLPPQAGAQGYLDAQARGALSEPPNPWWGPSLTLARPHLGARSPAPAPRREPSGTGSAARGCCVGRTRPSCATSMRQLLGNY